jgi:hypothetical protein
MHQVMQPVATISGGAPAILGDAICTHVIINQSINQSSILLCKRSDLGWWALFFCWWSQVLDFCSLLLEIAPSCYMFFRSYKQRHLLQPMSSEPGHYYNGVSMIRCSMENTENLLVFNPTTTQRQKCDLFWKNVYLYVAVLPIPEAPIV